MFWEGMSKRPKLRYFIKLIVKNYNLFIINITEQIITNRVITSDINKFVTKDKFII